MDIHGANLLPVFCPLSQLRTVLHPQNPGSFTLTPARLGVLRVPRGSPLELGTYRRFMEAGSLVHPKGLIMRCSETNPAARAE